MLRREAQRQERVAASSSTPVKPEMMTGGGQPAASSGAAAVPPAPAAGEKRTPEQMEAARAARTILTDLTEQKVLRAAYSERQLEEVMVDFWFNHFNVFAGKGATRGYLTEYERDVIRPHVFGRFRDLLARDRGEPGDAVLPRQLAERRGRGCGKVRAARDRHEPAAAEPGRRPGHGARAAAPARSAPAQPSAKRCRIAGRAASTRTTPAS